VSLLVEPVGAGLGSDVRGAGAGVGSVVRGAGTDAGRKRCS